MAKEEITYNDAISELESIIKRMQSADCDIDNLSKYAARSIELLKLCRAKLTKTDEELKKCLEELG
jgi:exodeoxyribonuclease VII small subunit